MRAVALTVAGSDPSGGAGIQADLKTFHQFNVYGEAAITLITVQNTQCVSRVEPLAPDLVVQQIEAVVSDIPPGAAKIGALGTAEIIEAVAELAKTFSFPLVVDPVMVSKQGSRLLSFDGEQILRRKLLPYTFLLTPNLPEAEALTGMTIRTEADAVAAADRLRDYGCKSVLVKGGHGTGDPVDVLSGPGVLDVFTGTRVETRHTHGTGCTFSAAITAGLALGQPLPEAIRGAKAFIQAAIEHAPNLGSGHGPVNHLAMTNAE
jgi:hydroxymethylpyrimidine/phosphomethylpyrimidine kinase